MLCASYSLHQHNIFESAMGNEATTSNLLRSMKWLTVTEYILRFMKKLKIAPVCAPLWVDHKMS